MSTSKIIFFGDISGVLGRQGIKTIIPKWRQKYQPDIFAANIENLAHNKGVTLKTLEEISQAGVSVFTGGNHIWKKQDLAELAENYQYKIATGINDRRTPDNYRYQSLNIQNSELIILSIQGETFIDYEDESISNPFTTADEVLAELPKNANIIVDMHAEATSDKKAMGYYLDGRVSAVLGTHTHVPTADAQILEKGTGYITDIGMVGAFESVLGIKKDIIIKKFLTGEKIIHDLPRAGQIEINAVLLEIDNNSHKTIHIQLLREIIN